MLLVASQYFCKMLVASEDSGWDPQQRKCAKYFLEGLLFHGNLRELPPKCHTVRPY